VPRFFDQQKPLIDICIQEISGCGKSLMRQTSGRIATKGTTSSQMRHLGYKKTVPQPVGHPAAAQLHQNDWLAFFKTEWFHSCE